MYKNKMKLFNIRNVLLVTVLIVCVHSGCVIRERRETSSKSTSNIGDGGITGFLTNLRCNIEYGAQQVKQTVHGGYNYVKKQFSTNNEHTEEVENIPNDDNKNNKNYNRNNNATTILLHNDDRIIFKNDEEEGIYDESRKSVPIVHVSDVPTTPVTLDAINKTNVTLGDRNAISAPIVCPKGQRLVDQKCVTIVEF